MKKYLFTLILLVSATFSAFAQGIVPSDALQHATVSAIISDAETGKTIASFEPERSVTPASITKLITTATALELLDSTFRFETAVAYDGTFANGTIDGNLYIIGSGDPSLGSRFVNDYYFLNRWCQQLKSLGVRHITGNIVADASVYDSEPIPSKWIWEDMGNYYGAGVYGLSVFDNTLNISMRSGDVGTQPTILKVTPQIEGLELYNFAQSTQTPMDSAFVRGMAYDNRRWIVGAVPANRGQFLLKGDIPNPPLCLVEQFAALLRRYGVTIDGTFSDHVANTLPRTTLFVHKSEPLSALVRVTNFTSNNNYAEHIFRRLAAQNATPASNNASIAVVKNFWQQRGISFDGISLNDGSGLSPMDAFSADFLNQILLKMYHSPQFPAYLNSIPLAGKEGTVKNFLTQNKTAQIHAKSGSMAGVQSYAGYIVKGRKTYTFCIIVNHFDSRKQVRKEIESWILNVVNKE